MTFFYLSLCAVCSLHFGTLRSVQNKNFPKKSARLIDNEDERIKHVVNNIMTKTSTSLTFNKVHKITEFIEKNFQSLIDKGEFYLQRHEGLPCALEYDPETKKIFIHTGDLLGRGGSKTFKKSILYDVDDPLMVAKANVAINIRTNQEITILKELSQVDRVTHLIASPIHKENGKRFQEIITTICLGGNIKDFFKKQSLSMKEKVSLATDLMEAIKNAHAHQIAHLDIYAKNILLEDNKDPNLKGIKYRAVLIDWGWAKRIKDSHDRFAKCDVRAAGRTIYALLKKSSGTRSFYEKTNQSRTVLKEQDNLVVEHNKIMTNRKIELDRKNRCNVITLDEKFEWIILSMLHLTLEDKRDAAYWYSELDALLTKML